MRKLSLVVLAMLALTLGGCSHMNVNTQMNCRIDGKESVNSTDSHQYRVYTSCGVYIVEDQMTRFNFSSADNYARLTVGKNYDLVVSGYRVPFLSMFPAINSYTESKI